MKKKRKTKKEEKERNANEAEGSTYEVSGDCRNQGHANLLNATFILTHPQLIVEDDKSVESDLGAINKLYGLLKINEDETSNPKSDLFDEHSRLVLKNLLDTATKKVVAGQMEALGSVFPSQLDDSPEKTQSRLAMTMPKSESWKQGIKDGGMMNDLDATSWNENKFTPASGQQKRCSFCYRNIPESSKMHDDNVASNFSRLDDRQREECDGYLTKNQQENKVSSLSNKLDESKNEALASNLDLDSIGVMNISSSERIVVEATSKDKDGGEIDSKTKEADSKTTNQRQIELLISALSDQLHQKSRGVSETNSVDPPMTMPTQYGASQRMVVDPLGCQMCYGVPNFSANETKNRIPREGSSHVPMDECIVMFPVNNIYSQNVQAMIGLPKWTMTPDYGTWSSSCMMNLGNTHPSLDSCFSGLTLGPPKNMKTKPSQMLMYCGNQSFSQHNNGISRNRHHSYLQSQESDSSSTDSYSNRTSSQTSSRGGDGDSEYSLGDDTGDSMSSRSPLSQYSSHTSGCVEDQDVFSSSSEEGAPQVTGISSDGNSSYEQPMHRHARPSKHKKSGPSRILKGRNQEKQFGGVWMRLKNRLTGMFHRHSHHQGDFTNDQAKKNMKSSLDQCKGEVKKDEKAHKRKSVDRTKKSMVRRRRQHSHFHGLVEGLLSHIRHSKKLKSGKGTAGNVQEKKYLHKSHWWRLLQHHYKGAKKLHHKTHKHLGVGKENA